VNPGRSPGLNIFHRGRWNFGGPAGRCFGVIGVGVFFGLLFRGLGV
jgi:hypothetical protein